MDLSIGQIEILRSNIKAFKNMNTKEVMYNLLINRHIDDQTYIELLDKSFDYINFVLIKNKKILLGFYNALIETDQKDLADLIYPAVYGESQPLSSTSSLKEVYTEFGSYLQNKVFINLTLIPIPNILNKNKIILEYYYVFFKNDKAFKYMEELGLYGGRPLHWLFLKIITAKYLSVLSKESFIDLDLDKGKVLFDIDSGKTTMEGLKEVKIKPLIVFIVRRGYRSFFMAVFYKVKLYVFPIFEDDTDVDIFVTWCGNNGIKAHENLYNPEFKKNPAFLLITIYLWLKNRYDFGLKEMLIITNEQFKYPIYQIKNWPMSIYAHKMFNWYYTLVMYVYEMYPKLNNKPVFEAIDKYINNQILRCAKNDNFSCTISQRYIMLNNIFGGARPNSGPEQIEIVDGHKFKYRSYSIKLLERISYKDLYKFRSTKTTDVFMMPLITAYIKIRYPMYITVNLYNEDPLEKFDKNKVLIISWTIILGLGLHATVVIYMPEEKTFSFFDPNGGANASMIFLESFKKKVGDGFNFKIINRACGIQTYEASLERNRDIKDLDGYCLFFSYLIIDLWAKNYKHDPTFDFELVEKCLIKLHEKGIINLTEYIREYFLFLSSLMFKVVHFAYEVIGGQARDMMLEDFSHMEVIRAVLDESYHLRNTIVKFYRNSDFKMIPGKATVMSDDRTIQEALEKTLGRHRRALSEEVVGNKRFKS